MPQRAKENISDMTVQRSVAVGYTLPTLGFFSCLRPKLSEKKVFVIKNFDVLCFSHSHAINLNGGQVHLQI